MTKRRFGLKPLRWLSVLGAIALLGVGEAKAQWTFHTSGHYPTISDTASSWAFDVFIMGQDGDVSYLCLDRVLSPSTDPLDLSTPITDNKGGTYVITKIGDWCFSNYATDVTGAVTLPDTLTDIGDYAFYVCDNLTEITIPAGVDRIGDFAFAHCTVLEKVVFLGSAPPSIIGYDIYDSSDYVISYVYSVNGQPPDEWEWVLDWGTSFDYPPAYWKFREIRCIDPTPVWFWDLSQSPMLIITNAVGWKFEVTILDQVNGKDMLSVGMCQHGPSVQSPLDFTGAIEGGALIVNYESAGDLSIGGLLGSAFGTANSLVLAATTTNIAPYAFYYCEDVVGPLVIPDAVVSIGKGAFARSNVTKIIIPASVQDIEDFAFGWNLGVDVEFLGGYPSGVVGDLYSWPREGVHAVTYIHVEHLQSWIASGEIDAWDDRTGSGLWRDSAIICLDYVPPPITYSWFWDSANGGMITNAVGWKFQVVQDGLSLTVTNCFKYPGVQGDGRVFPLDFSGFIEGGRTIATIGDTERSMFMEIVGFFKVGALTLPASLKCLEKYAFYICSNLTSVDFNGCSVTNIGYQTFAGCGLGEVMIPDSVKRIEYCAFLGNRSMTNLHLGTGVTYIGPGAFGNCSNIVGKLVLPDSLEIIAHSTLFSGGTFENCRKLTGIVFGSSPSLYNIGAYAFKGCDGLTGDLTLPDGVRFIGQDAFNNVALTSISVPASIDYIAENAFYTEDPSLNAVTFKGPYPILRVAPPLYYTGGNVTSYIHHAYATFAHNTFYSGSWKSNLDSGSPDLDEFGNARWEGRPIVCLGCTGNHKGRYVALDIGGISSALLVGGHDTFVEAEDGQPMPTITPPQMKAGTSVFIGYTNSLGKLYYDGSGNGTRLCDETIGDTLYAVWNDFVNQGTIVYIATPGSFADGSEMQIVEASISSLQDYYIFPSEDPTRNGYDFKGWTRVKDTLPLVIEGVDFVDFDYILYAYWEPKTPGDEIPVFINSIDVTPEGNVTLQWGNKQVKDVFGSPASYYKVLVSTDLVNWGDAPALETRDIGGTDDSVNMANATLPASTKRFFKVIAVK